MNLIAIPPDLESIGCGFNQRSQHNVAVVESNGICLFLTWKIGRLSFDSRLKWLEFNNVSQFNSVLYLGLNSSFDPFNMAADSEHLIKYRCNYKRGTIRSIQNSPWLSKTGADSQHPIQTLFGSNKV